jgi:hypothetical protein
MVPGLSNYLEAIPPSVMVDGGYYTSVPDNMPIIGPAGAEGSGFFTCAGLSGYGTVRGFRQGFTLEDAIEFHAFALLEALLCV